MFLLRIKSVELVCLLLHLLRRRHDFLADRISGEDDSVSREEPFHIVICHANLQGLFSYDLVGQTGKSVLLLNECRHSESSGSPEKGSACITTHSDGNIRLELADQLLGHADALEHLERKSKIRKGEFSLKSSNRQAHDLVACSRHLLHLHSSVSTDKKNLGLRVKFLEFVCN